MCKSDLAPLTVWIMGCV